MMNHKSTTRPPVPRRPPDRESRCCSASPIPGWRWLSFVQPETRDFLGVVFVYADCASESLEIARAIGAPAGADVWIFNLPAAMDPYCLPWAYRLLSYRELFLTGLKEPERALRAGVG